MLKYMAPKDIWQVDIVMEDGKKRGWHLTSTQLIVIGFFAVIIIGALLLSLPVSSDSGKPTCFVDALFTATTSVCVTGLVVVDTYSHWSFFGQVVILLLIQCGGLGIISIIAGLMVIVGKRVSLKERMILEDAFNLDQLSGVVKFLCRVCKGTFLVEGIGILCYCLVFVPEYGLRGVWISVFNGVSAFCNAGMDVIGPDSLTAFATHPWINLVTMLLIILGGLGFIVWWDVVRVFRLKKEGEIAVGQMFQKLSLHSKIVLTVTAALIFGGALCVFVMEYNNPDTIGTMSFGNKVMSCLFQSVTLRTAGFLTFSQKALRNSTAVVCIVMMFIGGSSVSTAGGIKTTTMAIVVLVTLSTIKGEEGVNVFRRRIPTKTVKKALSVFAISLAVLMVGIILLSIVMPDGEFMDVAYEMASAIGTVGLSRNLTARLNVLGKLLVIIYMFFGRVGPISMAIAFHLKNEEKSLATFPKENVTVG